LFSPVKKQDILSFDPKLGSHVENGSLVLETLPSSSNKIQPELEVTKPSFGLFRRIFHLLRKHKVQLFLCPDNVESSLVLALAKVAGVKRTIYGIHTDLSLFFHAKPISQVMDSKGLLFPVALFLHFTSCSRIADTCVVSSEAFRRQIADRLFYRFVKIDGAMESMLWSPHFRLPGESEAEIVARWRYELSDGHPEDPLALYVGRWSPEKRISMIRPALPAHWRLALVGDGTDQEVVDIEAGIAGFDRVKARREFLGSKDLALVYSCADFLVSASDFETFGFVALESLACGTPVAVENKGGFKQTVEDGTNGLLLSFDDVEETRRRLEEYSPGSLAYYELKKHVVESAKYSQSIETNSFSERFLRRHAPDLIPSVSSKDKKPSAAVVVGNQILNGAYHAFLWVYLLLCFIIMMTFVSIFT